MTNKKSTKLTALLLALVLVTACFIGGTIARYVTSTSSEDEARVAVWGINSDGVTMDLFNATYELPDGTVVAQSNDGDNIIAPGTSRDNYFSIVNMDDTLAPEVMYELRINIDDSDFQETILKNPSIQWRLDEGAYGTWEETKTQLLALSGDASGVKAYAPGELAEAFKAGETHTIGWTWVMDNNNDAMDTAMGNAAVNGDLTATVNIKVTAVQTDIDSTGMLEGNGSVYDLNDPDVLTFRSAAPIDEFKNVTISDGTETTTLVEDEDYTTEEGSTIIVLAQKYLEQLTKGKYILSIISDNMTAKAGFKVEENPNSLAHNTIVAEGGTYYVGVEPKYDSEDGYIYKLGNYNNATIYDEDDPLPIVVTTGDVYTYGDYEYRYNMYWNPRGWQINESQNGWGVRVLDNSKETYGDILVKINNKNITNLTYTFYQTNVTTSPKLPNTATNMYSTFYSSELVNMPNIPYSVTNLNSAFTDCTNLISTTTIPKNVKNATGLFMHCTKLTGTIKINANLEQYNGIFSEATLPITLTGSSPQLNDIASQYSNVTVAQ